MNFSPAIVRYAERHSFESFAIIMSWIGYLWMAFVVLFLFFGVLIDLFRLLLMVFKFNSIYRLLTPAHFILPLILSLSLLIYGYFEAKNLRVETLIIHTDKISRDTKIVQVSDFHIGLIIREAKVMDLLNKIREINPDIVLSTGDLVDGQIDRLDNIAELISQLKPKYGKYAITGNHEFYAGIKQASFFIEKAGFVLLRNDGRYLKDLNISIVGVDDPEAKRFETISNIPEQELLKRYTDKGFVILLKHRPLVDKNSINLFDLQLSGHTHKGQFFPFSLLTELYYDKQSGCVRNSEKCFLYISRGTGTWGPPIRIFSPPEITVIELIKIN